MNKNNTVIKTEEKKKKNNFLSNDFATQKVWKLLLNVSIPTLLMLSFNAMNDVTDALIAAHMIPNNVELVSSTGLSVESVTSSVVSASAYDSNIMYIAIAIITVVSIGSEIKYSRLLSEGKTEEAKQVIGTSIISTIVICSFAFIVLFGLTEHLVTLLNNGNNNANDELTIKMSSDYIRIELIWIFFFALTDLFVKFLRVEGKTLTVSLIASLTLPVNIIFDIIFLGPLGMSLYGCGLGSLMGEVISFSVLIVYVMSLKNKGETNLFSKGTQYVPSKKVLASSLLISAPIFISSIFQTVNSFSITSFATSLSAPESIKISLGINDNNFFSTSIAIFTEINAMMFLVIAGVAQAFCSIIAYNHSQKNYARVKSATIWSIFYMIIFMGAFQLIFQLLMPQLFWLWSLGGWPIEGINFSRALTAKAFFLGITYVLLSFYIAVDRKKESYAILFLSSIFVFYTIVPIFFAVFGGNSDNGYIIWAWSLSISEIISIVIVMPFFVKNLINIENIDDRKVPKDTWLKKLARDFKERLKVT